MAELQGVAYCCRGTRYSASTLVSGWAGWRDLTASTSVRFLKGMLGKSSTQGVKDAHSVSEHRHGNVKHPVNQLVPEPPNPPVQESNRMLTRSTVSSEKLVLDIIFVLLSVSIVVSLSKDHVMAVGGLAVRH
eukprot:3300620-Amphidinium_carterae.1